MVIKTAYDVQLLVDSMIWDKEQNLDDKVDVLQEIAEQELKRARHLVNQRLWDETLDDEMAAKARWQYIKDNHLFHEAILDWAQEQL
jgi:hypothetical protein